MSAFVRFTNIDLNIWDNECSQKSPWFKSMKITNENIIINILGLSSRFQDPFESNTKFSFREIFIGESHWTDFSILLNGNTFKSFNELKILFESFVEKFDKDHKIIVFNDQLNYVLNSICNKNKSNHFFDEALYSSDPVLLLKQWGLQVNYAPVIGSSELRSIVLWFNSELEALQFRDQLMMEVEDFYKNYASFVKEVILKKD